MLIVEVYKLFLCTGEHLFWMGMTYFIFRTNTADFPPTLTYFIAIVMFYIVLGDKKHLQITLSVSSYVYLVDYRRLGPVNAYRSWES